jgi:hypothetical protein
MNAVTHVKQHRGHVREEQRREERRKDRLRLRKVVSHDPCLLTFRCEGLTSTDEVDDGRLRWKGVLSFWDSFVDPLAGTRYVICTHPPHPQSPGKYFERVGKHMGWVMHSPEGRAFVGHRWRPTEEG